MKKMAILFMYMILLQTSFNASAQIQVLYEPIVHVTREVSIMKGGIIILNDTLVFEAPLNTTMVLSSMDIGSPAYFSVERRFFYILTEEGRWERLTCEKTGRTDSLIDFYRIDLASPISLNQNKKLYIKTSYLSVKQIEWDVDEYTAVIPVYPTLDFNISSLTFNMNLPVNSEIVKLDSIISFTNTTINSVPKVIHVANNLPPLRNENVTLKYKPSSDDHYLLTVESLTQQSTILQGKVMFENIYRLKNRGDSLNKLVLKIPKNASEIKAFDSVGTLDLTHKTMEGNETYIELTVRLRSSLRQNDRLSLRVEYYVPEGEFLSNTDEEYYFNYPLKEYSFYVYNLSLIVTLPEGAKFSSSTPSPNKIQQASLFSQSVQFNLGSFAPFDRADLLLHYDRSIIWGIFRPLQWVLIGLVTVGSSYIVYRRRPKKVEKLEVPTASPDLNVLLEYYRERLVLLIEFEQLDEDLEKREVSREHFERRIAEITKRLNELRTLIRGIEDRLKSDQPRLVEKLKTIKSADIELENAVSDLRNLQIRFRVRRIPRTEYVKKRRDAMRRLSQARRRLEDAVLSCNK
ncbi:MAG: hypothetical protein ACUVV4_01380 [Candidatus Bathyarchaeia archaeon]